MIKRVLLIATIIFILLIVNVKAATLTGNVHFIIRNANGTNLNYKLYNVTSTTGTITLFNGGISTLDNNGGGTWKRVDIFPFSAATLSDGQYCIKINSAWINITNSTGVLKTSLYDPLFWREVNSTGADIRFTNQSNELYFWIQDFNATTEQATIWVNVTAGSSELIMYYGNNLALKSNYDNESKTLVFADEFNKLDTSKWNTSLFSGTINVVNGELVLDSGGTGQDAIIAKYPIGTGYIVEIQAHDLLTYTSHNIFLVYLMNTTSVYHAIGLALGADKLGAVQVNFTSQTVTWLNYVLKTLTDADTYRLTLITYKNNTIRLNIYDVTTNTFVGTYSYTETSIGTFKYGIFTSEK